ncbi:MAG: hypothetical protein ACE15C_15765 [Phycisphaerae bacterium]
MKAPKRIHYADRKRFQETLDKVAKEYHDVLKGLAEGDSGEGTGDSADIGPKEVAKSVAAMRRKYGKMLKRIADK